MAVNLATTPYVRFGGDDSKFLFIAISFVVSKRLWFCFGANSLRLRKGEGALMEVTNLTSREGE